MFSFGRYTLGLLALMAVVYFSAVANSWFWTVRWIDIPMHFTGGFWLAMVFVYLNSKFNFGVIKENRFWVNLLVIVSFSVFVGVLWEFFEFSYDFFSNIQIGTIRSAQQGLADTIKDLFFDLSGGFVFVLLSHFVSFNISSVLGNKRTDL